MVDQIELVKNCFKFLKEDYRSVYLLGWINAGEIPKSAKLIEQDDAEPEEYFEDLQSNEWDEADYYGRIYLPFDDFTYMEFEVYA